MLFAKDILDKPEGNKKLQPGIHEGVTVTGVEVGDRWLDFNYANSDGDYNNKRIWFPELDKIRVDEGQSIADALKEADEVAFGHMVTHMRIFLSPDELNTFSAPDLKTAAIKCAALLTPRLKEQKINLKITFDKDGVWTRIPDKKYIEKNVEGQPTTLAFTDWELKNRMTKKQTPTSLPEDDGPLLY